MGAAHDMLEKAGPAGRAWLLDKGFLHDWRGGTDDDAASVKAGLEAYAANGGAQEAGPDYAAQLAGYEERYAALAAKVDALTTTLAGLTPAASTETAAPVAGATTATVPETPAPADPPAPPAPPA